MIFKLFLKTAHYFYNFWLIKKLFLVNRLLLVILGCLIIFFYLSSVGRAVQLAADNQSDVSASSAKYVPTTNNGQPVLVEITSSSPNEINIDLGYSIENSTNGSPINYTLEVTLWGDDNGNKIKEESENYYSGVIVYLYQDRNNNGVLDLTSDEMIKSLSTDSAGCVIFDSLVAGETYFTNINNYTSQLPLLNNGEFYVFTTENNPFKLAVGANTLSKTAVAIGIDVIKTKIFTINVLVWDDDNQNKTKQSAEKGLAGALVDLFIDVNGNSQLDFADDLFLQRATTSSSGQAVFGSLAAGAYLVYLDSRDSLKNVAKPSSGSYLLTTTNPVAVVFIAEGISGKNVSFGYYFTADKVAANTNMVVNTNTTPINNNNSPINPAVNSDNNHNGGENLNYNSSSNNQDNNINQEIGGVAPQFNTNSLVAKVVNVSIERPVAVVDQVLSVINDPRVEQINEQYVAPATFAIVVANAVAGIPWASFLAYLQYIFTEPLRFLLRGKRKGWGIVYNALSKHPVDLAIVRLYQVIRQKPPLGANFTSILAVNPTEGEVRSDYPELIKEDDDSGTFIKGKLLRTQVTDRHGRYNFIVDPGYYINTVTKPDYLFPTMFAKGKAEDSRYSDLYQGQIIEAKSIDDSITLNIPIDPKDSSTVPTDRRVFKSYYALMIKKSISYGGVFFAAVSLIISPRFSVALFCLGHLTLFTLFRRLALTYKPKSWGRIVDNKTKKPIGRAIVRIFDVEYNKLLDTQVTDGRGRYGFLASGPNNYYLTVSKEGYHGLRTDPLAVGDGGIVKQDLILIADSGTETKSL